MLYVLLGNKKTRKSKRLIESVSMKKIAKKLLENR